MAATPSPCEVLVVAGDGFLRDYVAEGLRRAGVAVVVADADHALGAAAGACRGAVLDVGLPAADLLRAGDVLAEREVPFVLIGTGHAPLPAEWQERPVLLQPFASFQVVEHLRGAGVVLPAPRAVEPGD